MDTSSFLPNAPGRLVKLTAEDTAFVPDPLPPRDWVLPEALWPKVAEARQGIGLLEGIGRNLPNPEILLKPLQNREALRSSSLEGTYATPEQLLLLELDESAKPQSNEGDAAREVANYGNALRAGVASELPLSLRLIKDMHRTLLEGVRGERETPGRFRRGQVYIGHDKRFIPPPLNELDGCLDAFEKYMNEGNDIDPLIRCYLVHYQFEAIHPFYDGNGRVGRLLLALMLQTWCGLTKPWLYMSAFFDRYKEEYVTKLFNISARAEWTRWLEFCLEGTVAQATDTIGRCQKLIDLKQAYHVRLLQTKGSVRLNELVDALFATPFTQIPRVSQQFGVTYPTAKSDVEALVKVGILDEIKDRNPRTFVAPEIFAIAFEEGET